MNTSYYAQGGEFPKVKQTLLIRLEEKKLIHSLIIPIQKHRLV